MFKSSSNKETNTRVIDLYGGHTARHRGLKYEQVVITCTVYEAVIRRRGRNGYEYDRENADQVRVEVQPF